MTSWDTPVRPRRAPLLLAAAAGLLIGTPARASIINVPADQPTIQAGIDAAAFFGDEVVIADGTYSGAGNHSLSLVKHITVRSASRNPALCIIDCTSSGRGFLISGVVSAAKVEGLTIRNGLAATGGGISCDNASPTLENCWILGNTANSVAGGGLSLENGSSPVVRNCRFGGNVSTGFWGGGGVWNYGGSPQFVNTVFNANRAQGVGVVGGAIRNMNGGQITLTNCTLYGNLAYDASGLYSEGTGTATTFTNSLVWGNQAGTTGVILQTHTGAVATVTYSSVQGGYAGTGNLATNPGLIDPDGPDNAAGNADDNLRPGRFSAGADAGNNAAPGLGGVTLDPDGNPRFVDDANIPDTGNGTAPLVDMGAYERQEDSVSQVVLVPGHATTIQGGIDLAQFGDEVVVADGTWTGGGNKDLLMTKDIVLRSASGNPNLCVIDCQGSGRGLRFEGASNNSVVRGFRITGGVADEGAGVLFDASGGTLLGCRIDGNQANAVGGAGVRIKNGSAPRLASTVITAGSTTGIGVIGGALHVNGASTPRVENCTLYGNSAYDASAIYADGAGTVVTVVNSILWSNAAGVTGTRIMIQGGASAAITYSDVEGGYAGTGNLNVNPIIMDADFRLAPISACIDAGSNAAVTVDEDYDGHLRIFDGDGNAQADVDMGAFEYGAPSAVGIGDPGGEPRIRLLKVWPNPSRLRTAIRFALPAPGEVTLEVFDPSGRRVATLFQGSLGAGEHELTWDGRSDRGIPAVAGVYFLRLSIPGGTEGRRLIRVR